MFDGYRDIGLFKDKESEMNEETIVALSTPSGSSAIAVIRLSGNECSLLACKIFGCKKVEPRRAMYSEYISVEGRVLDDVVYIFFESPNSYTGGDMLEIYTHGNPYIVQNILEDLFSRGCRAADAGEFTRRAYMNGRFDLSQAEAVSLLINARSDRALEAARRQLDGDLGKRINVMCDKLVEALAYIEAYIDFSDEDLPPESFNIPLRKIKEVLNDSEILVESSHYTNVIYDGLNIVIMGLPNAGKSSLMNALLGVDRAIVNERAGTTRDFIVERTVWGSYSVNITDTAGIRETSDDIEIEGINKALGKIRVADLKLLIIDGSEKDFEIYHEAKELLNPRDTIIVMNKSDKGGGFECTEFSDSGYDIVRVSCTSKVGIDDLKNKILGFIDKNRIVPARDDILLSARHANLLRVCRNSLKLSAEKIDRGMSSELIASDIRDGLESLGDIVGRGDSEEILDKIFSTFCLGK